MRLFLLVCVFVVCTGKEVSIENDNQNNELVSDLAIVASPPRTHQSLLPIAPIDANPHVRHHGQRPSHLQPHLDEIHRHQASAVKHHQPHLVEAISLEEAVEDTVTPVQGVPQLRSQLMQLTAQSKKDATSNANACRCTEDGLSGSVIVPYIGCGKHGDDDSAFCYVSDPQGCADFSRASEEFKGASWRYCDYHEPAPGMDEHTKLAHSAEDGYHKYTMQHSGVKATLITEGNKTLTPEQGKERAQTIIQQAKEDQTIQRSNLTQSMNDTKAMAEEAMTSALSQVGDSFDSILSTLHSTLEEALNDGKSNGSNTDSAPPPSFENLFEKIQSRVLASTAHLRPPPRDEDGSVTSTENRQVTLFDKMMQMSDHIVNKVNTKMDSVRQHMYEQAASSHDGPVSISARTDE